MVDLVAGKHGVEGAGGARSVAEEAEFGRYLDLTSQPTDPYIYRSPATIRMKDDGFDLTLMAWVRGISGTGDGIVEVFVDGGGTYDRVQIDYNFSSQYRCLHYGNGSSNWVASNGVGATSGEWDLVVGTVDGDGYCQVWVNGTSYTKSAQQTNLLSAAPDRIDIGHSIGYMLGDMKMAAVWARCLSDGEIESLWDPSSRWAMFESPGIQVAFAPPPPSEDLVGTAAIAVDAAADASPIVDIDGSSAIAVAASGDCPAIDPTIGLDGSAEILGPYFGADDVSLLIAALGSLEVDGACVGAAAIAVEGGGTLSGGLSLVSSVDLSIAASGNLDPLLFGTVAVGVDLAGNLSEDAAVDGSSAIAVAASGEANNYRIFASASIAIGEAASLSESKTRIAAAASVGVEAAAETVFSDTASTDRTLTLVEGVADDLSLTVVLY